MVSLYSAIKMMHGPINIRFLYFLCKKKKTYGYAVPLPKISTQNQQPH